MKKLLLPALAALGFVSSTAQAETITYQVSDDVFGNLGLFAPVTIDSPVYDGTFNAGHFALSSASMGDFLAFCVEVTQAITNGADYTNTPTLFSAAVIDNIDRLYSSAYASVTDGVTAAAFQVSLWEIVEDTATGIDLGSGAFSAVDASAPGVVATAQGFLDGLATAQTGLYEIDFFASPASQDVVTARLAPSAVPLPASGLLLLTAGGLLAARRRTR